MNPVIEALRFRHACKRFDPAKKIPREQLELILTAGHLSPTSFGLEAWKLLVIESDDVKKALRPSCWDQPQVTEASHVVVILARPEVATPDSEYIRDNFERRELPRDMAEAYIAKYKNHMDTEVFPRMSAYAWCSKQCYIVLANMMTAAAAQGIDSCPMEGFEKDRVEEALNIDTAKYEVAVLVALGYRLNDQPPRKRRPLSSMVEYL